MRASKKALIALISLVSIVVFAGTILDSNFNSNGFMQDSEIKMVRTLDDSYKRHVASDNRIVRKAPQSVDCSDRESFEGSWEIIQYVRKYNDKSEDDIEKISVLAEIKFINNGCKLQIMDEEEYQVFIPILKRSANTLGLYKGLSDGYELLELKRPSKKSKKVVSNRIEKSEKEIEVNESTVIEDDEDSFVLGSVNQHKSFKGISKNDIEGSVNIADGKIANLEIAYGEHTVALGFADILNGGVVITDIEIDGDIEERVSLMVNRNGKGYSVRFATGSIGGAVFSFITEGAFDEKNLGNNDETIDQEEEIEEAKEEIAIEQEDASEERKEMNEVAEQEGFDFSDNA